MAADVLYYILCVLEPRAMKMAGPKIFLFDLFEGDDEKTSVRTAQLSLSLLASKLWMPPFANKWTWTLRI